MGCFRVGRVLVFASLTALCPSFAKENRLSLGGIHIPIVRTPATLAQRAVTAGSIGLGDFDDVSYAVQVVIGGTHIPVVLDTGSSDLWVLSTSCEQTCSSSSNKNNSQKIQFYPPTSFRSAGIGTTLIYGDSTTGTYAKGPIGSDSVSLAGLALQGQYFAAINSTNTSVVQTGAAGILGLGFPYNSLFWTELLQSQNQISGNTNGKGRRDLLTEADEGHARFSDRLQNLAVRWFRKTDLANAVGSPLEKSMAQMTTATLQSSIITYGPLIPRLVAQGMLDSPMFSITLQRDTIQIGGNEGMLSIGQLPSTVQSESLTWVNVRGYPASQGGLSAPADAPGEVYPVAWEIPVDDVWFDGVKLARSKMSSPSISLSALLDTGNSLIRGPPDVVTQIYSRLGGPKFACSPPHSLVFQIAGKMFPVDPRDFVSQVRASDPDMCVANVVATDVPVSDGTGYLYSWNLGDPFLKGVLAAFHYGSLTHPSQNPPRVGLLSTIDPNAGKQLCDDKHVAEENHKGYPMIAEPAPASLPPPRGTGIGGVPLAPQPSTTESGIPELLTNGGLEEVRIGVGVWTSVLTAFVTWATWRVAG
ncbi:aspartic peptidase domain-containing protein [Chiua virens]|nr:aspartic peptidase domain-containing protein [Chiua virens]